MLGVPIPQYYFHSLGYSVQKIMRISEAPIFFPISMFTDEGTNDVHNSQFAGMISLD